MSLDIPHVTSLFVAHCGHSLTCVPACPPAGRPTGLSGCLHVCAPTCPPCCLVAKSHAPWVCALQAIVAYTYPPFACRTAAARHDRSMCDRGRPRTDSASVGTYPCNTSGQPSATAPQLLAGSSRSLRPPLQRRGQRRRRRQGRPAAGACPRRECGPGPTPEVARPVLVEGPRRRPGLAVSARRLQSYTHDTHTHTQTHTHTYTRTRTHTHTQTD